MKRKTITLVVYMLVCISLVSVGFAAWVITGGDSSETTGNITATTVLDKSLTISEEDWDGDSTTAGSITFGKPSGATNVGWLQADATDAVDKKEATYSFKLSSDVDLNTAVATAKIEFTDSVLDAVQAAGYISDPKVEYQTSTSEDKSVWSDPVEYKLDNANKAASATAFKNALSVASKYIYVKITISYTWGQDFDGENPYVYYNKTQVVDEVTSYVRPASGANANGLYLLNGELSDSSNGELASNKEEAKYALTQIYEAVYGGTEDFQLTITLEGQGAN